MTALLNAALYHLELLRRHLGPKPPPSLREMAAVVCEGFRI